jgi:competence protein ComEA
MRLLRRLLPVIALLGFAPLAVYAEPVNINTADAATLAKALVGVGLAKAEAIVEFRKKNGAFKSADELALVKGIGPKVIERNRANIRIDRGVRPAATSAPVKPSGTAPAKPASRGTG